MAANRLCYGTVREPLGKEFKSLPALSLAIRARSCLQAEKIELVTRIDYLTEYVELAESRKAFTYNHLRLVDGLEVRPRIWRHDARGARRATLLWLDVPLPMLVSHLSPLSRPSNRPKSGGAVLCLRRGLQPRLPSSRLSRRTLPRS